MLYFVCRESSCFWWWMVGTVHGKGKGRRGCGLGMALPHSVVQALSPLFLVVPFFFGQRSKQNTKASNFINLT